MALKQIPNLSMYSQKGNVLFSKPKYNFDVVIDNRWDGWGLGEQIITQFIVHRLRANKPVIIALTGQSGEGKSYASLRLLELINKYYGVEPNLDVSMIFTPLQYSKKVQAFTDKKLKKHKVLILDEGRELISAKTWQTFINRAITDVNAMLRKLKRFVLIVNTQSLADIDKAQRRQLTLIGFCNRPLRKHTKVYFYRVYEDRRDLENLRLKKKPLKVLVRYKRPAYVLIPAYFTISTPNKELTKLYETQSYYEKAKIIKRKLKMLQEKMEKEAGVAEDKVETLLEYIKNNPEHGITMFSKRGRRLRLKEQFIKIFELEKDEVKELENKIEDVLGGVYG